MIKSNAILGSARARNYNSCMLKSDMVNYMLFIHNTVRRNFLLVVFAALPFAMCAQNKETRTENQETTEPLNLYQQVNDLLTANNVKAAVELFDKVVALYVLQGRESELTQSYFGMALALALNGNYKESIHYHKKAIKAHHRFRDDEPTEIVINLGLTYRLAGKERKARRILGDDYSFAKTAKRTR